jgi:hypothetical protein
MANSNGWGDGAANNAIGWGQGANNAIGWGDIHADSWAGLTDIVGITTPPVDPDAQAFITAAAITDPTQQAAINTLVVDLKGYSIWTKFKAIYPIVGGTASSHAVNLKTPGTFNLTFASGMTHSANGMVGNGSTGYADTNFTPSTNGMLLNSAHLSFYSRTDLNTYQVEMGNWDSSASTLLLIRQSGNGSVRMNNGAGLVNFANTNAQGFYLSNRTASNVIKAFKNGTSQVTSTLASNSLPTNKIALLAFNNTGLIDYYSTKQCSFASIGDGLTDTDSANLYTAVQAYQTTLGRSIGTQIVSDPDAQAFINAAAIDDQVQANAINNLVIGMKADGLWSKMKAIYPVVGGSASSHAVNLKTPGTYNLTNLNTGWTHDANGMTSLNTFAGTGIQPSTVLGLNDTHLSYFISGFESTQACMIGAYNAPNRLAMYSQGLYGVNSAAWSSYTYSGGGAKFRIVSRLSSTVQKFANNGTIQTATLNSSARPTANIELARLGGATDNFNGICKFASIGDGLTDTDITNFNTRVTTYQTALSRYN